MPFIIAVLCLNQRRIIRVKTNIMLNGCQVRLQPCDDGREHRIIHQHAILGMVDDVDQLLIEQAYIERVDNAAHANRTVPGGQMAMMVHRKGRNAVGGAQSHRNKGLRQLSCFQRHTSPVRALDRAVTPTSHNLARAIFARGMIDQMSHAQ